MPQGFIEFPQIDPVLVSIGPLSVRWYGLMYLFGFLFAMWLANRRADKKGSGWTREQVSDLLFLGFLVWCWWSCWLCFLLQFSHF